MRFNVEPAPYSPEAVLRFEAAIALRYWLKTIVFTHFVTFNFNGPTSLASGRRALKRFHAKLDRHLHGRRFNRLPSAQRTFFIAFPENVASNLHYHALLRTDSGDFSMVAPAIWNKLVPSGDFFNSTDDVKKALQAFLTEEAPKPIGTEDRGRIGQYITKEAMKQYGDFVLSTEF